MNWLREDERQKRRRILDEMNAEYGDNYDGVSRPYAVRLEQIRAESARRQKAVRRAARYDWANTRFGKSSRGVA